jgi:hypothetical protein
MGIVICGNPAEIGGPYCTLHLMQVSSIFSDGLTIIYVKIINFFPSRFAPSLIHVGSVGDKVALGQVYL